MHIVKIAITFLLLTFFSRVHAQSVVLCESYDSGGKASGIYSLWSTGIAGANVYIVYNQPEIMQYGTWYLYLDRDWDNNGTYGPAETLPIQPEGKSWFVYDYKFTEPSKYKASVMRDGMELASSYFEIKYKPGEEPAAVLPELTYFDNSTVQFCTSVDEQGNPVGVSSSFSTGAAGKATFRVYIDNAGMPFKTSKMLIEIYDEEDYEFDVYSVEVPPESDYLSFEEELSTPGTYYFDFYTAEDVFVNTATITIER